MTYESPLAEGETVPITVGMAAHYITIAERDGYDPVTAEELLKDALRQLSRPMVLAGLDITRDTPKASIFRTALASLERLDTGENGLIMNTFGPKTGRFLIVLCGRLIA